MYVVILMIKNWLFLWNLICYFVVKNFIHKLSKYLIVILCATLCDNYHVKSFAKSTVNQDWKLKTWYNLNNITFITMKMYLYLNLLFNFWSIMLILSWKCAKFFSLFWNIIVWQIVCLNVLNECINQIFFQFMFSYRCQMWVF